MDTIIEKDGRTICRRISLPRPPSLNRYYRHVGNKTLISEDGRAYREWVCSHLKRTMPLQEKIRLVVEFQQTDKRRRDLDNYLKCLLDSMTHAGVYEDDSQIDDLRIYRPTTDELQNLIITLEE